MVKHFLSYALLVAVMLLAACSEKNEYARVIPQDASVVGSVQLSALVQKSGLTAQENQKVLENLKKSITQGLPADQAKLMDGILADPQESGIDFTKPVYLFVQPDGTTSGLVACVKSSDKLHDVADVLAGQQVCSQVEEKDGASWTENGKSVFAFTNEVLLMASGRMKAEDLKKQMTVWLGNTVERSFVGTKEYKEMTDTKADVAFVNGLDLLPVELRSMIQAGMPQDARLGDIRMLTAVRFENGKMVADMQMIYKNAELKKMAEAQIAALDKLEGTFMDAYPENTFCWMTLRGNGAKLYEQLDKQKVFGSSLFTLPVDLDLKPLFEAVDGTVALGMSVSEDQIPMVSLFAEVKNADFLKGMVDQLKPIVALAGRYMRLVPTGKDSYELQLADGSNFGMGAGPTSVCMGVRDKRFYLTNDKLLLNEGVKGKGLTKAPWAGEVNGKRFFMALNVEGIRQLILAQAPRQSRDLAALFVDNFRYTTIDVKDAEHVTMTAASADEKTNILKQWVDLGLKMSGVVR